jgi:hypothetical protein
MDSFKFTLYELFGYMAPGLVLFFALIVASWSLFSPNATLVLNVSALNVREIAIGLFVSYLLGHFCQGLHVKWLSAAKIPGALRDRVVSHAAACVGIEHLKEDLAVRVSDEYAIQHGKAGDREVFVYREGFYRGTAIALFVLTVALFLRIARGPASIVFGPVPHILSRIEVGSLAMLVLLMAWVYVRRFQRFSNYRVTRSLLAFLVALPGSEPNKH